MDRIGRRGAAAVVVNRRPAQPGRLLFKVLFVLVSAGFCAGVFVTSLFVGSFAAFLLLGAAGVDRMSPSGINGTLLLGQFLTALIAVAATYATFAGLRWVWRGFDAR